MAITSKTAPASTWAPSSARTSTIWPIDCVATTAWACALGSVRSQISKIWKRRPTLVGGMERVPPSGNASIYE